jgi:hypothetical protein
MRRLRPTASPSAICRRPVSRVRRRRGSVRPNVSLYASYAESFQQLIGVAADGSTFEPTRGTQYEAGARMNLFGGAATISGSVFQITQTNLTIADTANPGFSIQLGEVESRGAELELAGRFGPRLELIGGFSYLENEIVGGPMTATASPTCMRPRRVCSPITRLSTRTCCAGQSALALAELGRPRHRYHLWRPVPWGAYRRRLCRHAGGGVARGGGRRTGAAERAPVRAPGRRSVSAADATRRLEDAEVRVPLRFSRVMLRRRTKRLRA